MRKIPTVFERNEAGDVTPTVADGCRWVFREDLDVLGTFMWFGPWVMITRAGRLYHAVTLGPDDTRPAEFWETSKPNDDGEQTGWVLVPNEAASFVENFDPHWQAFGSNGRPGVYTVVGPGVAGNPHKLQTHSLRRLADTRLAYADMATKGGFDRLRMWLGSYQEHSAPIEAVGGELLDGFGGIVWKMYTNDGPDREHRALFAQLKATDFAKAPEDG